MFSLSSLGRMFYGLGIIAYGTQQIIIRDFRPQIVPGFPSWVHTNSILPIITGFLMIAVGLAISGIVKVNMNFRKRLSLYIGFYFFALIPLSHIPYLLFVYPHKLSHLGSWGDLLKELAFSGASFIVAGSCLFSLGEKDLSGRENKIVKAMIPVGRLFYCTTIILFGCNHFAYDISFMVPKWLGMPKFWSYFGGAALIAAGAAILLQVLARLAALLLALMLFLWFCLLHLPNAIADPIAGRGNAVVSAFDALLLCGTALIISEIRSRREKRIREKYSVKEVKIGRTVEGNMHMLLRPGNKSEGC